MGEHIEVDGVTRNIGTCNDLYYIRLSTFKRLLAAKRLEREPGNLFPEEYLDENRRFRFRFPFPDEDEIEIYSGYEFSRGWPIRNVPFFVLPMPEHGDVTATISTTAGRWPKTGRTFPCPQHPDGDAATVDFEIIQQKPVEGEARVVVRCPYCQQVWSLDWSEAGPLVGWMNGQEGRDDEWYEVAKRIEAGYKLD